MALEPLPESPRTPGLFIHVRVLQELAHERARHHRAEDEHQQLPWFMWMFGVGEDDLGGLVGEAQNLAQKVSPKLERNFAEALDIHLLLVPAAQQTQHARVIFRL